MKTAIHRMVESARAGGDPTVIVRLASGWAVFGRRQFVRGYALLLPDPVVPHLNALDAASRLQFLDDMARLGDALLVETGALRVNYAMFGNQEPALHAHVVPRYADEPPEMRGAHPWAYDWGAAPEYDARDFASLAGAVRLRLVGQPQSQLAGEALEGV